MTRRCVLLSIKPVFAALMYAGKKKFEYRRSQARILPGDTVLMYESSPLSLLTGWFTAGRVIIGSADQLPALEEESDIRQAVADYLKGARACTAIEVTEPHRWSNPLPLTTVLPGRRPVQSYAFVEVEEHGLFCRHQ